MAGFHQIVIAFIIAASVSSAVAFGQNEETVRLLLKLLSIPQKPERYALDVNLKYPQPNTPTVTEFIWQTCGAASDPVSASVALSPDPLPIPGNITLSVNATLGVDVVSPVKLALTIEKKVLFWITIPCVDNVGSCTYDDVCVLLAQQFPTTCPPPFSTYSLPCHCPFKADKYTLPKSVIEVKNINIPTWLTSGDYKIKARGTDSTGKELACYDLALTLN